MKKRIHIFDEWDIVQKLVLPCFTTDNEHYSRTAMSLNWVTTEHGGTGYACFDFSVPYPEDYHFYGTPLTKYLDAVSKQWVYRRADLIEEPGPLAADRARNWVNATLMVRGIPGCWLCLLCGYSTIGEADSSTFPERHLAWHGGTREQFVPLIIKRTPHMPPLPIGTFYARTHKPGDQWFVCQISPKNDYRRDIPWSEKILSTHATKQEAKQELIRRLTKK